MPDNLPAEEAWVRFLCHLEASLIVPEADLRCDLRTIIRQAEVATGATLTINVTRILEGAALIAGPS